MPNLNKPSPGRNDIRIALIILAGILAFAAYSYFQPRGHLEQELNKGITDTGSVTPVSQNEEKPRVEVKSCEEYKSEAYTMGKLFVKDHLEHPLDAEFPSSFGMGFSCKDKRFNIMHIVKAANGLGIKVTYQYLLSIEFKGGEWTDKKNWEEIEFSFAR